MRRILVFMISVYAVFTQAEEPVFPGANLFESTRITDTRFSLAVGGMEKQDGLWRPEKQLKVSVEGERKTYEVGYEASVDEVFAFYSLRYKPAVLKQLFSCEALDCGSSAQWANGYFGVRELYGPDRDQRLVVWLVEEGAQQQVVTLYVIQRGNRKVYAHIDALNLMQPLQVSAARSVLLATVFDAVSMRSDEKRDLARQIRAAQKDGAHVWLVGHAYGSDSQQDNINMGLASAETLANAFAVLGVEGLNVESVGMLAPLGEAAVDRVAIIATHHD